MPSLGRHHWSVSLCAASHQECGGRPRANTPHARCGRKAPSISVRRFSCRRSETEPKRDFAEEEWQTEQQGERHPADKKPLGSFSRAGDENRPGLAAEGRVTSMLLGGPELRSRQTGVKVGIS